MSPVTKTAGGKITGAIGLTLEATAAVANGDPAMITGDYECQKADGSKPVVGVVTAIRQDVPATGGNRTATVPGEVSVDAFGQSVHTFKAAGALAAGILVGIDSAGRIAAPGAGVSNIGVTLMAAAAQDDDVDVLVGAGL